MAFPLSFIFLPARHIRLPHLPTTKERSGKKKTCVPPLPYHTILHDTSSPIHFRPFTKPHLTLYPFSRSGKPWRAPSPAPGRKRNLFHKLNIFRRTRSLPFPLNRLRTAAATMGTAQTQPQSEGQAGTRTQRRGLRRVAASLPSPRRNNWPYLHYPDLGAQSDREIYEEMMIVGESGTVSEQSL